MCVSGLHWVTEGDQGQRTDRGLDRTRPLYTSQESGLAAENRKGEDNRAGWSCNPNYGSVLLQTDPLL